MAAAADDAKIQSFLQQLQANGADLRGRMIRACGRQGFGVIFTAAEPSISEACSTEVGRIVKLMLLSTV